ncbi:MAG: ABC transporter ATP-binding protein [Parvularculaceae bacterium]
MSELRGSSLTLTAGDKTLVEDASFSLERGEFVALLGPNGAGKTSLIRTALGLEKKYSGEARLFGEDIKGLSPMERARRIAYLPQIRPLAWPNIVRDVVALGRYSHGAAPGRLSSLDALAVDRAIEACDLVHLAQRRTTTLSGGEWDVSTARAFAAEAPLLIADEPTAALDPRHQFRIMELIKSICGKRRRGARRPARHTTRAAIRIKINLDEGRTHPGFRLAGGNAERGAPSIRVRCSRQG